MKKVFSVIIVAAACVMLLASCGKKTPVETAEAYIGRQMSELVSEIGEPAASQYQDSCEKPGTQDGFLDYDGFTVVTEKNDSGEIVTRIDK